MIIRKIEKIEKTEKIEKIENIITYTISVQIPPGACAKVVSEIGVGFRQVFRLPPPIIHGNHDLAAIW